MTVYIGVDLHKTQFTVHVRVGDRIESLSEIKQYPTRLQQSVIRSFLKGSPRTRQAALM